MVMATHGCLLVRCGSVAARVVQVHAEDKSPAHQVGDVVHVSRIPKSGWVYLSVFRGFASTTGWATGTYCCLVPDDDAAEAIWRLGV